MLVAFDILETQTYCSYGFLDLKHFVPFDAVKNCKNNSESNMKRDFMRGEIKGFPKYERLFDRKLRVSNQAESKMHLFTIVTSRVLIESNNFKKAYSLLAIHSYSLRATPSNLM